MGSRKKTKSSFIFWGIIAFAAFGLVLVSATESTVFSFEINSARIAPSDRIGQSSSPAVQCDSEGNCVGDDVSDVGLPNVKCFVKSSMQVLDENGKIIASGESTFLIKRPTSPFSVLKVSDGQIAEKIKIEPKIKCEIDNDVPMTVSNAQLKATIFGKNENNQKIEVWNDNKRNTGIQVTKHDSVLMTFNANAEDIFKFLPEGNYESDLEMKINGVIDISYDAAPVVNYEIIVPIDSIKTFVDVSVEDNPEPENDGQGAGSSSTGGGNEVTLQDEFVDELDSIGELVSCAAAFDANCMLQGEFLPFYFIGFGLTAIILGTVTKNNPPVRFDEFGNRIG